ncbi:sensor histidine kinase [Cognatilysobacter terrigena]|uniref:sensor histidine kinase n=1 Tax=Cognatilysobacter terrigena TaxID=2488749 RepID=UPI001FEA5C41|nr:ATP-binding protein [Lysobacter terrigena]
MPMDAPVPPHRSPVQAALPLVPVLLIALGVPYALHLDLRAAAAVTVGTLAAAAFAASAMRRALDGTSDPAADCERSLLELADTLPQGVLLVVEGHVHAANPAARTLLGLGDGDLAALDVATLFIDPHDATAVIDAAPFDRDVLMRRRGAGPLEAHVSARDVDLGGAVTRLVQVSDRGADRALAARLDAQRAELETLTRRLMSVQEDERASLSRELHDDIGQAITAIKLCASSLMHEPDPPRTAVVAETAQEIGQIADQTVAKLRDLSLLLRPPQLDALGLEAALRWQAGALFRGDLPAIELDIPPLDCRPPRDVELACFRIAQEALTNVLRHARAGRVVVHLHCDDVELRLRVEDDGRGIPADHRAGLGLITMRERARLVGGALTLESRPGRTTIEAVLPLPPESDARAGVLQG